VLEVVGNGIPHIVITRAAADVIAPAGSPILPLGFVLGHQIRGARYRAATGFALCSAAGARLVRKNAAILFTAAIAPLPS
jgi:hypothetical protein